MNNDELRQEIQHVLDTHTFTDQTAYSPGLQEDLLINLEQLVASHVAAARIAAIQEFCQDIQRKVTLEFEAGGRYPGHLIDPWTDIVRRIIYSAANKEPSK